MVELRVDAVEGTGMPKDCFVSVRVGDTQKLSRLSQARSYRFPQAGDRRYGKIEVFKRIGVCSLDVDPGNAETRDVVINCDDAGFGRLGLKINVEADEVTKRKHAANDKLLPCEPTGRAGAQKVKDAKSYLVRHGLEARLSEAMQCLLRERPDDPASFLASRLIGNNKGAADASDTKPPPVRIKTGQDLLPENEAAAAQPMTIVPLKGYYPVNFKSMDEVAFQKIYRHFPRGGSPAKAAAMNPGALVSLSSSYTSDFRKMDQAAFQKIHDRFPAAKRPVVEGPTMNPSASQQMAIVPFRSYYSSNLLPLDSTSLAELFNDFPAVKREESGQPVVLEPFQFQPPVGTWPAPSRDKVRETNTVKQHEIDRKLNAWAKVPSVGTWLAPAPAISKFSFERAVEQSEQDERQSCKWAKKPSIGTWLAKPLPVNRFSGGIPKDIPPRPPQYNRLPSVGTRLAPAPEEPPPRPFQLLASVCTWLAPAPEP